MVKVVKFEQRHLDEIKIKDIQKSERPESIHGYAFTLVSGEVPLAIYWVTELSLGVMQIWSLISEDCLKQPLSFFKETKLALRWLFEHFKLHRAQMSVKVGYEAGWRFAETLGFECEGVMKSYSPDKSDCWLFGRTR